jgi:hypothetical protein
MPAFRIICFFLLEIILLVWSVAWFVALYSIGVENQECSIDEEIRLPICLSVCLKPKMFRMKDKLSV